MVIHPLHCSRFDTRWRQPPRNFWSTFSDGSCEENCYFLLRYYMWTRMPWPQEIRWYEVHNLSMLINILQLECWWLTEIRALTSTSCHTRNVSLHPLCSRLTRAPCVLLLNFKVTSPVFSHFSSLIFFAEKLYEVEHPHYVKQVEAVACVLEGEMGFWISKKWYKGNSFVIYLSVLWLDLFSDWRLLRPRMHVTYQGDPPPDSSEFHNHIYCEHGSLTLNVTNRRKISAQVRTSYTDNVHRFNVF